MQAMLPPGTGRGQAKGINSTENNYGKEEDNIRQFYTWCHRMYDGGRNINACRTTERSAIAFLYRLADCLYGLSVSQVLPIQTKAEKPHPFHFCALFLITVVGVALFYLLVPPMVSEIGRMNDLLVSYLTNGGGSNVPKTLSEFVHENLDLVALNKMLSEENILAAIKETVPKMWALLAESLNILFSIFASFIILLYVVFILLDYEAIAEGWLHLLPQ